MEVLKTLKNRTILWLSNPISKYTLDGNEITLLKSHPEESPVLSHSLQHYAQQQWHGNKETTFKSPLTVDERIKKMQDGYIHTNTHAHVHTMEYYSAIKRSNSYRLQQHRWNKDIMLSELRQGKTNTIWSHLYEESKKTELMVTE